MFTAKVNKEKKYIVLKDNEFLKTCRMQKYLLIMLLPAFLMVLVFNYFPMYGIIIAFKNYLPGMTIIDSPFVGLKWFVSFFHGPYAQRIITNTFILGGYSLLWGFPMPIILALLLNEIRSKRFKKMVQTVSYLPYFISVVITVGMLQNLTSMDGLFNYIRIHFGMQAINFFAKPEFFRTLFIGSGIWQGIGWGSIIYLAALSGVDVQLYEAATIDGANRWHKLLHVTFPAIVPTICILFILNVGNFLNQDYQKILLMYNSQTYVVADVINTYTYREGIEGGMYSYTAAIGLIMSIVSFIFVWLTNTISKKLSGNSIW